MATAALTTTSDSDLPGQPDGVTLPPQPGEDTVESLFRAEDKDLLFRKMRTEIKNDQTHWAEWREDARINYDLIANHQWEGDVSLDLEAAGKVPVIFNRVLSVVKAVAGHEINNRQQVYYYPRGVEDTAANEVLSSASDWMGDGCDADDEESDAFEDTIITGLGWTEHVINYDVDPEGKYHEMRVDPLEMVPDRYAKARDLVDMRRVSRIRSDIALEDAKKMFPGYDDVALDAQWARSDGYGKDPVPIELKRRRANGEDIGIGDDEQRYAGPAYARTVTIVETQWWTHHVIYEIASHLGTTETDEEGYERFKERAERMGLPFEAMRKVRRVYRRAFLGASGILEEMLSPAGSEFTYACITGERDRNNGTWFSLVSVMRDPQMFANKWLTNTLHILNTTANGGVMAEEDAFEEPRDAEDTWAQPNKITWVTEGALSGGKIKEKPMAQFPQGYFQLSEFAVSAVRDTVGVNLELLGMVDRTQAGVLENQRKQAAVTILATLFANLRRFRKTVGRIRLYYIQNYFSDGRIIRVVGPSEAKAVPLAMESTTGQYDTQIDESSTNVNQKMETWGLLQSIIPAVREFITPEVLLMFLSYSPLPSSLVNELQKMFKASEEQQSTEAAEQAKQQQQIMTQALIAGIDKDKKQATKYGADAQKALADAAQTIVETQQLGTPLDPNVQNLLEMAGGYVDAQQQQAPLQ